MYKDNVLARVFKYFEKIYFQTIKLNKKIFKYLF